MVSQVADLVAEFDELSSDRGLHPGLTLNHHRFDVRRGVVEFNRHESLLRALLQILEHTLISGIIGNDQEEVVGRQLRESGQTIAVAESCTAGMLGMHITRVPGSSSYFKGGIICYDNNAKAELCGVPRDLLQKYGAVSAEVAEAMARGVRLELHSTIGLSITGIAGPGGGSPEKPVGLVFIGIADGNQSESRHRVMPGDRETIRERSSYLALSWLRKFLMRPGQ